MLNKLVALVCVMCMLSYAHAGTLSIGTISVRGDMRIDNHLVRGDATLFNGSVIETAKASADLRLGKGDSIFLAADSRGTLYRDHLVLERGQSEVTTKSYFGIEAAGLHISPAVPNSHGVVVLQSKEKVDVAASDGEFKVTNDQGILVAIVRPGKALSLNVIASGRNGAMGADPTTVIVSGVVIKENGKYFVTDSKTAVRFELTGSNLDAWVDKAADISGTVSGAEGANGAQILQVSKIENIQLGGTGGTTPGVTGMSLGAKAAIIGGISAAGTVVGFAAAGTFTGTTPASR